MNKTWYLILLIAMGSFQSANGLTLDEYLSQVRSKNEGYKAESMKITAAVERSDEWKTAYMPTLFVEGMYDSNGRPTNVPAFQGNKTILQRVSLGIQQETNFGLTARLSENIESTELLGIPPGSLLPTNKWTDVYPMLELTQSLWKNGFGSETRSKVAKTEAEAQAAKYEQSFNIKRRLAEAEAAYWKLSLAQKLVKISRESVARAEKVLEWASRRSKLDLADKSDRLAAEAGLKLRSAELQGAEQELNTASRHFNSIRNVQSETANETLEEIPESRLLALEVPKRGEIRDDVRAAAAQRTVASSNIQSAIERNSPQLDLTGKFLLTGRDLSAGEALRESLGTQHPTYTVGVKFTAPLDFGRHAETRAAYVDEQKAAELGYARKLLEQDVDWKTLVSNFESLKVRYKMIVDVEATQKEKTDFEQERLKKGRTTTFVAVQYEQDYLQARKQRVQLEVELLGLVAQMKTYGDSYESR